MNIDSLHAAGVDSETSDASPRRIDARLLVTIALLAAAAPFAMDLYLPAFPQMVADLGTSTTGVQLSLTAFLVGAGLGQVVFGPLSDRIGRTRPLVLGTLVYVIASAAAAFAPTIALLIVARLVQGLSGAAGMVIGRAIISDLARGREAARAFSLMMLVTGVAPVVAPLAGSLLAGLIGWRGLLWIVTGLGALALAATLAFVRETLPAERRAPRAAGEVAAEVRLLLNRRFAGNALAFAFAFGTMIAYISASPFLYQGIMGLSQLAYGLVFGLNALVLAVVGGLSARLVKRFSPVRLARTGLLTNLGAILVMAAMIVAGVPAIWLTAPILVAVGSLGLVLGNTTALALAEVKGAAGLGSAALGLLQFGLAGALAPLVSLGGNETVLPLAVTMLGASLVAISAFVFAGHGLGLKRTSSGALVPQLHQEA